MSRRGSEGLSRLRLLLAILVLALIASACGGGSSHGSPSSRAVTVLMVRGPDSLDPAVGDTPEALEADWLAYTPLLTYVHADGTPGTELLPGLAEQLPKITDSGKVYSFTLQPGLTYSNGQPVRATDFAWAVKRAVKLWPEARRFVTNRIVGASAFASGRARAISGVTADDATGLIRVYLTAPDGSFENVLASPALAPVPWGTPFRDERRHPPPGVGPYEIAHVVVGRSFSLVKNPRWRGKWNAYVPTGHLATIDAKVTGDAGGNAEAVLDNRADVFDFSDEIPVSLVPTIERDAADRYRRRAMNGTYLIFLGVTSKPFSSPLAREAVRAGLNQDTVSGLDDGNLLKGCYLLPPSLYGHPHDACPDGNKAGDGNLPLAQSLAKESGMAGSRVTVWSPADSPFAGWMAYYTSLLNQIGFKARLKTVPAASYYRTIGAARLHSQTGFDGTYQEFVNPAGFYEQLTAKAIQTRNGNWGKIDDPYINSTVRVLAAVPASSVYAVATFWHKLELYVAKNAYIAVLGYPTFPEFVSDRIDLRAVTFSPVVGLDWSSLKLK